MADVAYLTASGVVYNIADATFRDMYSYDSGTQKKKLIPDIVEPQDSFVMKNNGTDSITMSAATGEIVCTSVEAISARDKKTDIEDFKDSALDIINNTNIVKFKYKVENELAMPHVGFIADDTNPLMSGADQRHYRIGDCVGLLLKAVQELTQKNKELEDKIKELESK